MKILTLQYTETPTEMAAWESGFSMGWDWHRDCERGPIQRPYIGSYMRRCPYWKAGFAAGWEGRDNTQASNRRANRDLAR